MLRVLAKGTTNTYVRVHLALHDSQRKIGNAALSFRCPGPQYSHRTQRSILYGRKLQMEKREDSPKCTEYNESLGKTKLCTWENQVSWWPKNTVHALIFSRIGLLRGTLQCPGGASRSIAVLLRAKRSGSRDASSFSSRAFSSTYFNAQVTESEYSMLNTTQAVGYHPTQIPLPLCGLPDLNHTLGLWEVSRGVTEV